MTDIDAAPDLRDSPRRPFTVELTVSWEGGEFTCSTVDMSLAGLFLETEEAVPVDTPIRFDGVLEVGGDRWRLLGLGEVARGVRVEDPAATAAIPGLGVRITEVFLGEDALTRALGEAAALLRENEPERGDRRSPRILVGVPVRWGPTWPPDRDGYLSNVSSSGALVLASDEPLEPGSAIHLSLELPSGREISGVRTLATVVRRSESAALGGHCMGLEFVAETPTERVFRRAVAGDEDSAPRSAALPGSYGGPAMDFSSMSVRTDEPAPSRLEALSETIHGTGGFRWGTVGRIVGIGLLIAALLWIGFVCVDSFSAGGSG